MSRIHDFFSGIWGDRSVDGQRDSNSADAPQARRKTGQNENTDRQKSGTTSVEDLVADNQSFQLPREQLTTHAVGPYTLEDEIGRGGMGTVWSAKQQEPVKRRVAIKLINAGPDSQQFVQRFESERNNLALMNHPAIATMFDAGKTEEGQLFFAMELVNGPNLVDYCNKNRLSTNDRLRLFLDACSAVQHAHQKGIIHRDLKPSNILVGTIDRKPQLKVIDFGLSKLENSSTGRSRKTRIQRSNAGHLDLTRDGQVIGSVRYMSPEQAAGETNKVDTRADVYSLGIVLYELLTGSVPIDKNSLNDVPVSSILDAIQNEPDLLPSEMVSRATPLDLKKRLSQQRSSLKTLQRNLKKELDWIVMKAIQKHPDDRYKTVSEFATDIKRFLNNEPVSARPGSNFYKLRKSVSRNRVLWGSAACIVAALMVGTVLATIGLVRAINAEKIAELRLEQSRKSNEVLADIFADMDVYAIEMETEPFKVMAARNLVAASKRLDGETVDDPLENVKLQIKLAHALNSFEFYKDSIPIGLGALNVTSEQEDFSDLRFEAGKVYVRALIGAAKTDQAEVALIPLLELSKQSQGPESENHLDLLLLSGMVSHANYDFASAYQKFATVAAKREANPDSSELEIYDAKYWMARCYSRKTANDDSLPSMKDVVEYYKEALPTGHPRSIRATLNYGWAISDSGNFSKGLLHAEEGLELALKTYGNEHPSTYDAMLTVGLLVHRRGDFERGGPLLEKAWEGLSESVGARHPRAITAPIMLAQMCERIGDYGRAIELLEQAMALSKGNRGIEVQLADVYAKVGEYGKARAVTQTLLDKYDIEKAGRPPSHLSPFSLMYHIADFYGQEKRYPEAIALLRQSRDGFERTEETYNFPAMRSNLTLARYLAKNGQHEEATQVIQTYLAEMPEEFGPKNRLRLCCEAETGVLLLLSGKPQEAAMQLESVVMSGVMLRHNEFLIRQWRLAMKESGLHEQMMSTIDRELSGYPRRFRPNSIRHAMQLRTLGYDLIQLEQSERAIELLTESVAMLEEEKHGTWNHVITQFDIARLKMDQQTTDAADENRILELENAWASLEKMKEAAFPIQRSSLKDSIKALVHVCESKGNETYAETWRDRLESFQ